MRLRVCLGASALLFFFSSCGKAPRIEGTVLDDAGRPLAGASVKLDGSTFAATTDAKGHYALDYVPGKQTVVFASAGTIPDTLRLEIAAKAYFPAKEIRLISIPQAPDVYWLSPHGQVALPQTKIQESFHDTGAALFGGKRIFSYRVDPSDAIDVPAGDVTFVDSEPSDQELFKVNDAGVVGDVDTGPFGMRLGVRFDRPAEDNRTPVPGVVVRKSTLTPGLYAYCEVRGVGSDITPLGTARVFRVGTAPEATAAKPAEPAPVAAPTNSGLTDADAKAVAIRFLRSAADGNTGTNILRAPALAGWKGIVSQTADQAKAEAAISAIVQIARAGSFRDTTVVMSGSFGFHRNPIRGWMVNEVIFDNDAVHYAWEMSYDDKGVAIVGGEED